MRTKMKVRATSPYTYLVGSPSSTTTVYNRPVVVGLLVLVLATLAPAVVVITAIVVVPSLLATDALRVACSIVGDFAEPARDLVKVAGVPRVHLVLAPDTVDEALVDDERMHVDDVAARMAMDEREPLALECRVRGNGFPSELVDRSILTARVLGGDEGEVEGLGGEDDLLAE